MRRALALAVVVIGGAVLVWLWTGGAGGPSGSAETPTPPVASRPRQDTRLDAPAGAPRAKPRARRLAAEARRKLGAAIAAARRRRQDAHAAEGVAPSGASMEPAKLDSAYIRERIKDIVPLVKECYENALEEKPDLEGRIFVEFAIGGEPDVGAVVEDSKILDNSTITDASLLECVRETMYALELEPPERGGRVVVVYPFKFARRGPPPGPERR